MMGFLESILWLIGWLIVSPKTPAPSTDDSDPTNEVPHDPNAPGDDRLCPRCRFPDP
jgi:hypothetical protein